jgi:predicted nucleic acid-binding protein
VVLRVVLDACVLYPVALRDSLLRLAELDLLQVVWSRRILDEMKLAILRRRPDIASSRIDLMTDAMRTAFPEAEVDGWEALEGDMLNHPDDRHVLALAVHARAEMVVTANLRHFPAEVCQPYGIEAITPDELLCRLLENSAPTVLRMVQQFSNDTDNPPMSITEILDAISRSAPLFAERARTLLTQLDE